MKSFPLLVALVMLALLYLLAGDRIAPASEAPASSPLQRLVDGHLAAGTR